MTPTVGQQVVDLRLDRRALRAERARVAWWRRLVRARLDLAVASVSGPGPLGEDVAFHLPVDVGVHVPRPSELGVVLAGADPAAELARVNELRDLDSRLAVYLAGVDEALQTTTNRLVSHLAGSPGATLAAIAELPGRG
ncbi:hypothetical protein [Cellulomonas soli]|nr:hypothetical protein [Cellulomonas soli]NYI59244.1 hypothetical protein [Cellulomonas soli]